VLGVLGSVRATGGASKEPDGFQKARSGVRWPGEAGMQGRRERDGESPTRVSFFTAHTDAGARGRSTAGGMIEKERGRREKAVSS